MSARFSRRLLLAFASLVYRGSDPTYPQTWAWWSFWGRRIGLYRLGQWWCGRSGHEWSKTEWGYGGGPMVDRWCRWCNKMGQVPKAEHELTPDQTELMGLLGEEL